MLLFIICLLCVFCITFITLIYYSKSNTIKIISVLREIKSGNLNRRANLMAADRVTCELVSELNLLADRFNEVIVTKNQLEDTQKKLISNISHDLRTPLTSILGYIEALKKDCSLTPEERENYIEIIDVKAKTLYKLVQDFFEMAKLESEDQLFKFSKINICAKLKEVTAEFYHDFISNEIEPEIAIPDYPIYVLGDETSVSRIMHNLLSNALKYGRDGRVTGIGLREEKKRVWVDVWDKGKGIVESDMKLIFERLYTAESSRNEKLHGSGLGLAIAKRLIERMNGEITASSIPWEKTMFSFSLLKYE